MATAVLSRSIINEGSSVLASFWEAIESMGFSLKKGDVVVISSKVVSMEERRLVDLSTVTPSEAALDLANKTTLSPEVVQLILNESEEEIIGYMNKSILVRSKYGIFSNAGVDTSNVPKGHALLLPEDCNRTALRYYNEIKEKVGLRIPVILVDTKSIPLRWGSMGVAIGYAGLKPLIDYRGQVDLFGNEIKFSMRGIADNLATMGTIVMGEIAERTPFAVIRGVEFELAENQDTKLDIEPENCLYFGPFLKKKN